jgi:hypothetical protein
MNINMIQSTKYKTTRRNLNSLSLFRSYNNSEYSIHNLVEA